MTTAEGPVMKSKVTAARRVFMVLSPRSLSYARLALDSLYRNCVEKCEIHLVTDSEEDKETLEQELEQLTNSRGPTEKYWSVHSFSDLDEPEDAKFSRYAHIRQFRRGHPCWRKITDPILLSDDQNEMVLLDPDIYFPNRFRFEPTPKTGVYLMWQKPSCLLPPEVVQAAIDLKIPLAHHTDIGVAQWRLPIDLDWLNWLIEKLGSSRLPRNMHVESIVWAALAMRLGGGYLDRKQWLCWHRSQYKRFRLKAGAPGVSILRQEDFSAVKCFHAGGEAKWWMESAYQLGLLDGNGCVTSSVGFDPFVELSPFHYKSLQMRNKLLRTLGYYSFFRQA